MLLWNLSQLSPPSFQGSVCIILRRKTLPYFLRNVLGSLGFSKSKLSRFLGKGQLFWLLLLLTAYDVRNDDLCEFCSEADNSLSPKKLDKAKKIICIKRQGVILGYMLPGHVRAFLHEAIMAVTISLSSISPSMYLLK